MQTKILEVHPDAPSFFFRFLQFIAQKKNWDIQFLENKKFEKTQINEVDAALVDVRISSEVLKSYSVLPTLCKGLLAQDSIFKEDNKDYPRLLAYEALQSLLITETAEWDNREPVFVAGNTELIKVAAGAVCAMGAKTVYLIGDEKKLAVHLKTLKKFQLGIEFYIVPADELTAFEISGGLLINTVDLEKEKDLFVALSYFNFLNANSYVVDVQIDGKHQELFDEAQKAEITCVPNEKFFGHWASVWWNRFKQSKQALSPVEGIEFCKEFLR